MRPIQNAGGHVGLNARNYPIAGDTAVAAGQVVKLSAGRVVSAAAAENGAVLGIAAENHPGVADVLNMRADGTEILVYDNPGLLFECPAPRIAAQSGTATTVSAKTGELAASVADGGYTDSVLQLRAKAAASANPDSLGQCYRVTGYTKTGSVLARESGGVPSAGDEFALYPAIGSTVGALDEARQKLIVSATGASSIRVIGHDYDRGMIRCMAVKHALASST